MATKKNNKRKIFIIIVGVITLVTVGLAIKEDKRRTNEEFLPPVQRINAEFGCADGKSIDATFVNSRDSYVELNLSDGRKFDLSQVISADGAKYTSGDETVVFWNKGNTAFLQENGVETYTACNIVVN